MFKPPSEMNKTEILYALRASVEPHDHAPSAMHMGDCSICGHVEDAPIHRSLTREESK